MPAAAGFGNRGGARILQEPISEQAGDAAVVGQGDIHGGGMGRQARHGEDAAGQRNREARAAAGGKAPDMQGRGPADGPAAALSLREYWVLAMQTGAYSRPRAAICASCSSASGLYSTGGGAVNLLGDGFDFSPAGAWRGW